MNHNLTDQLADFIRSLDQLVDETIASIDSAMMSDEFVSLAESNLVIPNIATDIAE